MARTAKYTPEQRREIKRLQNRIYYYKRILPNIEAELKNLFDQIVNDNLEQSMATTLQDVRPLIGDDIDSSDPILNLILDQDKYYTGDFRKHLLDAGLERQADDLSRRAGLGSIDSYKARQKEMQDNLAHYSKLSERLDTINNILNDSINELKELRK